MTIIILLCLAWGLLILLSACKAASRNPLEFNSRGAASQLNPGQRPGAECDDRGQFTSADQSETNPYSAELGGSAGARNSISSIGTGPATAQGPHPRVIAPGNSASELLRADARKISSLSKSAMAPALTGNFLGCHSWPTLKSSQPHRLVLQASRPKLALLLIVGETIS